MCIELEKVKTVYECTQWENNLTTLSNTCCIFSISDHVPPQFFLSHKHNLISLASFDMVVFFCFKWQQVFLYIYVDELLQIHLQGKFLAIRVLGLRNHIWHFNTYLKITFQKNLHWGKCNFFCAVSNCFLCSFFPYPICCHIPVIYLYPNISTPSINKEDRQMDE